MDRRVKQGKAGPQALTVSKALQVLTAPQQS
jgi:hypothetical protein